MGWIWKLILRVILLFVEPLLIWTPIESRTAALQAGSLLSERVWFLSWHLRTCRCPTRFGSLPVSPCFCPSPSFAAAAAATAAAVRDVMRWWPRSRASLTTCNFLLSEYFGMVLGFFGRPGSGPELRCPAPTALAAAMLGFIDSHLLWFQLRCFVYYDMRKKRSNASKRVRRASDSSWRACVSSWRACFRWGSNAKLNLLRESQSAFPSLKIKPY